MQLFFDFFVVIIIAFLLYIYLKTHNKKKLIISEKEEISTLLTQISLQKDEIEALYEETYAINEELNKYQGELELHIKELSAMNDIAKTINSSLSIDEVLKHICLEARKILDYDIAAIMTVNSSHDRLIVKHCTGIAVENMHGRTVDITHEGICGYVARTKKPILVHDVKNFPGYIEIHSGVKQEMSAPLIFGDEMLGVFNVESLKDNNFDDDKLNLLCAFANLAAMALNNARLYENIANTYYLTSKSLAKAIEAKDRYTRGHCDRVTELATKTAEFMGFDIKRINSLKFAATLHDIGKIGISESILNKAGALNTDEFNQIKMHPKIGCDILSEIDFLEHERRIIYQHHERIDGRGYPQGLKGDEILLEAKILAIADSFDAMTSKRSYKEPMPVYAALEEIRRNIGTQFDADVSEIFIDMIKKEFPIEQIA